MQYIDVHSHLNFTHFDHDQEKVVSEMKDKGIGAINIGIDLETSRESIELAETHDHIWASIGCHPTEASPDFTIDDYRKTLSKLGTAAVPNKVVAVGECGLDYSRSEYRSEKQKSLQDDVFVAQIKLAAEADLPLILHIRPQENSMDAYERGLDILAHFQNKLGADLTGTAHFFVGDKEIASRFLELGFYVSFTGPLTYDQRLQDVCAYIPKDRLLAETDSPFATPEPHRGKRNSPLYISRIVAQFAACHDVQKGIMRDRLSKNTKQLFSLTA